MQKGRADARPFLFHALSLRRQRPFCSRFCVPQHELAGPIEADERGVLRESRQASLEMAQYRTGFFGPGKLDGSLLNWVNGALLKEVAHREGYDVNFRPFKYRKDTKTSILYTTRRD